MNVDPNISKTLRSFITVLPTRPPPRKTCTFSNTAVIISNFAILYCTNCHFCISQSTVQQYKVRSTPYKPFRTVTWKMKKNQIWPIDTIIFAMNCTAAVENHYLVTKSPATPMPYTKNCTNNTAVCTPCFVCS